jgi:hypothetical protein
MNKRYYIEWNGGLNLLKRWIRENHHLINGYVFNPDDTTHRIESKLIQLGWNSIYDASNNWQILTLSDEIGTHNTVINTELISKSKKTDSIGKIIIENGIVKKEKFIFHTQNLDNTFDLNWLQNQMNFLSEEIIHINIEKRAFEKNGEYNKIIREKINPNKLGCYIFSTPINEEILYIGMAGKLKTNGEYSNHSIASRLQAPRTKDIVTKKEITTEKYLKYLLDVIEKDKLRISVLFVKNDVPSGYLEAVLLYQFYVKYKVLPLLNNAF